MMLAFDVERILARDAARMAGLLCLTVRREMLRHPETMLKTGDEPVTIADYGAQAVILQRISERAWGDGVYAEEHAAEFDQLADHMQRLHVVHHVGEVLGHTVSLDDVRRWLDYGRDLASSRIWAVDPIDGTKGFLRGDQFAVAIALLVDNVPSVAAMACPLLSLTPSHPEGERGVIFVAALGQGATIEPLRGGAVRPVRVSARSDVIEARVIESVEPRHTDHAFSTRVMETSRIGGGTVRMDSQAKYGAVADGRAEIYIRHSPGEEYREKVWDHAAGALIVQEAGGTVTDLDGKPLDFGHGMRLEHNHGVLATNGPIHQAILDAIGQVKTRS